MKKLVLIGGGGHCRSVMDAAIRMNEFDDIAIVDPGILRGTIVMGYPVVGDDSMLLQLQNNGFQYAFITVGNVGDASLRKKLFLMSNEYGFIYPDIIDPSAVVSEYSELGEGVFIGKNAVVNAGARIGDHVIINTGAIIEHDCMIGEFSHIAVGACICGECKIQEGSFVGANSTVIQEVSIKKNSFIKAGSIVKGDI